MTSTTEKSRILRRCIDGALLCIAFAVASNAHADIRIGGWSLLANGQPAKNFEYSGPCPVSLKFGWGVVSAEPVQATYTFQRNDGGRSSSQQNAELAGSGRSTPIYDDWRLGANTPEFSNYRGWVQLDIASPSRLFQRIAFTLHCGGAGNGNGSLRGTARIGGWSLRANGQLAKNFEYSGPCPVSLKFGWGVVSPEPAQATYTFQRNDGGHSSSQQSAALVGSGRSTPIYEDWRLGANTPNFSNYRGWVQLDLESPTRLSQRINFTLHCGP